MSSLFAISRPTSTTSHLIFFQCLHFTTHLFGFFLRFKINKLLIFVVGLAIFFPSILDQIGLMLGFFFLFKKAKINQYLIDLFFGIIQGVQNFVFRYSKQKYIKMLQVKKKFTSQGVHLNPLNSMWHRHYTKVKESTLQ